MSYIQKFLKQHLPLFYLEQLRQHLNQPQFLLFNNQHNIFDLTLDLILSSQNCLQSSQLPQSSFELAQLCKISYQGLREVQLPIKEQDNEIIKVLKSSLKYVHMQMLQILIRLVLCFYECVKVKAINDTLSTIVEEIALIYPVLKLQASFSQTQINLSQFFAKYLAKIMQSVPFNEVSRQALRRIASKAQFNGPIEKLFLKYTQKQLKNSSQTDLNLNMAMNELQQIGNRNKNQIIFSKELNKKQQKMSLNCGEKQQQSDDFQLFRNRKRKLIAKRRPTQRPETLDLGYKTPYREKEMSELNTPNTSKTLRVSSDTTQHNPSSILYRRLLTRVAIPKITRTIYFSQMYKFKPQKKSDFDPQQYIEKVTASSLAIQCPKPFEQVAKKNERKAPESKRQEQDDNRIFCVPATPKPDLLLKKRSHSTQKFNSTKYLKP